MREGLDRVVGVQYDEATGNSVVTQAEPATIDEGELLAAEVGD